MTIQTETLLRTIPLTKLVVWKDNVRKTGIETGLDELEASIAAHGLLNPLTVCSSPKGKFSVIAGQRRLLALKALAKAGTISKAYPVACAVRDDDSDPAELSLAENVVRVAMHPADQLEAWRGLVEQGFQIHEIAARFGVAESTVRKRLALASVSPVLFAAYRDGAMSLEALQAFTVSTDHAAQEAVWNSLSEWEQDNPQAIRRALTESDVPCTDRRVRFIGLEAYESTGGTVRRDLFDTRISGYVQDAALLDRLVTEKLEAAEADIRAEGWQWTETRTNFDWQDRRDFRTAQPDTVPLPDDMQAEADALEAEAEALDGDEPEAAERLSAIDQRLEEINAASCVWTVETKAKAGAIVSLGYDGTVEVDRGLIRVDASAAGPDREADRQPATKDKKGDKPDALPASLIEELTAQKTAAFRAELAQSPAMALALVTHAMALSAFYHVPQGVLKAGVTTRTLRPSIKSHDGCKAIISLETERTRILDRLPGDADDLLAWCLTALQDDLLDVLAVAAAHGLDAVVGKRHPNKRGVAEGEALAKAIGLDMAMWYSPTADGYYGRVSKSRILADLAEARGKPNAPSWEMMKKADLAALAEREVAATGWLPATLR